MIGVIAQASYAPPIREDMTHSNDGRCQVHLQQQKINDNLLFEDDDFFLALQGCVLNVHDLVTSCHCDTLKDAILVLYRQYAGKLCMKIKGSYSLVIYDKRIDRVYLLNDLLSKTPLYYYISGGVVIFASSYFALMNLLESGGYGFTLDALAIKVMLSAGTLIDDMTYANEVKYLKPYDLICVDSDISLQTIPVPASAVMRESDLVREMDRLFTDAVRLQFEKTFERGYHFFSFLSGGMDSRTVVKAGCRLGYHAQTCLTYAEPGSKDQQIAQRVASHYGFAHLFVSMNGGEFLKNRTELEIGTEGMTYYAGTTALLDMMKLIRLSDVGIINSGVGGGEILGDDFRVVRSESSRRKYIDRYVSALECSDEESDRLRTMFAAYADVGQFLNLNTIRTCLASVRVAAPFAQVFSPFLDEDFYSFVLTVPAELRMGRSLYRKWLRACMPDSFDDTSSKGTLASPRAIRYLRSTFYRVLAKLKVKTAYDMNPFEEWCAQRPDLRAELSKMLVNDMTALEGADAGILDLVMARFDKNVFGKLFALTVTGVLSRYFTLDRKLGPRVE